MREAYRWLSRQKGVIFINNSIAGARAYEAWLSLPQDTIRVIHNGFDFERLEDTPQIQSNISIRKQYNIPDNATLIGTVIRFSVEKRPDLWLHIADQILKRSQAVHFLLVGNGPLLDEAINLVQ
ncbi:MAG: hypothetical protein GTO02_07720, partial [Candidatus Dadabacteria bacterium]|nr:hypothetical protein [Candidatus Dadabacteria bacterium]